MVKKQAAKAESGPTLVKCVLKADVVIHVRTEGGKVEQRSGTVELTRNQIRAFADLIESIGEEV